MFVVLLSTFFTKFILGVPYPEREFLCKVHFLDESGMWFHHFDDFENIFGSQFIKYIYLSMD